MFHKLIYYRVIRVNMSMSILYIAWNAFPTPRDGFLSSIKKGVLFITGCIKAIRVVKKPVFYLIIWWLFWNRLDLH